MKSSETKYRFRKCSDINREHAIFELLDGEITLMDVSVSEAGVLEIAFHEGIANRVLNAAEFMRLFEEGKRLASND